MKIQEANVYRHLRRIAIDALRSEYSPNSTARVDHTATKELVLDPAIVFTASASDTNATSVLRFENLITSIIKRARCYFGNKEVANVQSANHYLGLWHSHTLSPDLQNAHLRNLGIGTESDRQAIGEGNEYCVPLSFLFPGLFDHGIRPAMNRVGVRLEFDLAPADECVITDGNLSTESYSITDMRLVGRAIDLDDGDECELVYSLPVDIQETITGTQQTVHSNVSKSSVRRLMGKLQANNLTSAASGEGKYFVDTENGKFQDTTSSNLNALSVRVGSRRFPDRDISVGDDRAGYLYELYLENCRPSSFDYTKTSEGKPGYMSTLLFPPPIDSKSYVAEDQMVISLSLELFSEKGTVSGVPTSQGEDVITTLRFDSTPSNTDFIAFLVYDRHLVIKGDSVGYHD